VILITRWAITAKAIATAIADSIRKRDKAQALLAAKTEPYEPTSTGLASRTRMETLAQCNALRRDAAVVAIGKD